MGFDLFCQWPITRWQWVVFTINFVRNYVKFVREGNKHFDLKSSLWFISLNWFIIFEAADGLKYYDVIEGNGPVAEKGSTVQVCLWWEMKNILISCLLDLYLPPFGLCFFTGTFWLYVSRHYSSVKSRVKTLGWKSNHCSGSFCFSLLHMSRILVYTLKHNVRDEMLVLAWHCSTKCITISHFHVFSIFFCFCLVELIIH